MAKEFLSQKGINYIDRDVTSDPVAAQEMITKTGQRGVPVILVNGQIVIGFDRTRLEQLLSQSQYKPGFGASVADAIKITYNKNSGAYVGNVRETSTASKLGLQSGDIIVEINGRVVLNSDDLVTVLSRLKPGDSISISYVRNGERNTTAGQF